MATDPIIGQVLADVAARDPIDGRERDSIEQVLAIVPGLARPLDEHADPVHVTGSAFIVGPRGIVLLRHRRLGIWVQPGGHIDPGETPWDAARREAAEETGLPVRHLDGQPELAHVDVHHGGRGHTHLDLRYLFTAGDADPAPPPEESQDVGWYAWDAAPGIAEATMAGILGVLAARFGEDRR
ncbi:MAG TPA: NUDIX domain-containing protein [Ilumatobacteraceae bacterium]|nr:NUDIX domain-containing protein [Ilumatobacteraceae bacterium]